MTVLAAGALEPRGPVAETIADLWWFMFALGLAVFVVFAALLGASLIRRRHEEDPSTGERAPDAPSRWLIWGGVVLPLVVVTAVFGATVVAMRDTPTTAPSEALVVEVVGHQWWWEVRYPEEGVTTANVVHVPVGRPVAFRLSSADVIHSFWVPSLGGKMDALPDGTNTLVLQADEAGEHRGACAEFCGLQHARMDLLVVAEPAEGFAAWVAGQRELAAEATGALAERGRELFGDARCASCHVIRGLTEVGVEGPDLTHLASRPTIGAGAAGNTAMELAEWIADPHTVKEGVKMPATDLDEEDRAALLAYLEGLE
ncbi:MAG: cytochrome c oxidase subunit II [Acidimicrobiales bacterium]